jgi:hypothetical protein
MTSLAQLCVSPEEEGSIISARQHVYNEFLAFAPQFLQLHEEEGGGEREGNNLAPILLRGDPRRMRRAESA